MANTHLATYLNDHLAGSVIALEMLGHIEAAQAGTAVQPAAAELRADIAADRHELEELMGRLGVAQSGPRKAMAWLSEKAAQLKLRLDDKTSGALHLLEALEAVATGVEGKKALWLSLAAAAEDVAALRIADYAALVRRAEDQRCRVEVLRLGAAKAALGGTA